MKRWSRNKVKVKLWTLLVRYSRKTGAYLFLYKSYWHYLIKGRSTNCDKSTIYYTTRPNPGAGIGHQMANWNAGYWWAKQFGLKFSHFPFSSKKWDEFLGFGEGEITVDELRSKGYLIRKLPLFSESKQKELDLQRDIISSYTGKKIVFLAEQDQGYKNQYDVMEEMQRKFYSASARKNDNLIYENKHFNIALHIRRGDIMSYSKNPNLVGRKLGNDYYINVLNQVLARFCREKETHIYLFSQGNPEDFPEFNKFKNLHWCLDMSAQQSFLHMVYADLLITSKSSFSYKPALINKGIKFCPMDFWHGYPDKEDWILCDINGKLLIQ